MTEDTKKSKVLEALIQTVDIRKEADNKVKALLKPIVPIPDWPPEGMELLDESELMRKSQMVEIDTNPWVFREPVPEDAICRNEDGSTYVSLAYAMKHGKPSHRVHTMKLCMDINQIAADADERIKTAVGDLNDALLVHIKSFDDVKTVSDLHVWTAIEDYLLTMWMSTLVLGNPTDAYIENLHLQEFVGRATQLIRDILKEEEIPAEAGMTPPDLVWELSERDAELAVKGIRATNPGSGDAITGPQDLLTMSFLGHKVKSIDSLVTVLNKVSA